MAFPWRDPQFWIVTGAALLALGYMLRKRLRIRRGGEKPGSGLPCDHCSQAEEHRRSSRGGTALVLLLLLPAVLSAQVPTMIERRVALMGTALDVRVELPADLRTDLRQEVDRAPALALAEIAIAAVAETEELLSTWRSDSELSRFNRAPAGARVALSPATMGALEVALDCTAESAGAFDPTVAPLLEAWGTRSGGRLPSAEEIAAARARLGAARLRPGRTPAGWHQPGGLQLEEGGFGKGAGLDLALVRVGERAPRAALWLDFGGQIAWTGQSSPVVVRLADPRDRSRAVLELTLTAARGSLATSGNSERAATVKRADGGEVQVGHLIDPRSGYPAASFGSATVFAASATVADCRSTALFVLGADAGARWLGEPAAGREGALLVVEGGALRALLTPALAGQARSLVPEIRIERIGVSSESG